MPLSEFVPRVTFKKGDLRKNLYFKSFRSTQLGMADKQNSGYYVNFNEFGTYRCIVCDEEKFKSEDKVASFGWATFIKASGIAEIDMIGAKKREYVAAHCENCGAIMGEIKEEYPNGFKEKSWWINSTALKFIDRDGVKRDDPKKNTIKDLLKSIFRPL